MFEVDTSKDFIEFKESGKTERISIQSALTRIANGEKNATLINAIEQRVFKERQSKIKYLAVEMINRYLKVFKYNNLGSNINFVSIDSDENDIKKIFNSVRELIKKQENVVKLRSLFKNYNENNNTKENLIENYDFGTGVDG